MRRESCASMVWSAAGMRLNKSTKRLVTFAAVALRAGAWCGRTRNGLPNMQNTQTKEPQYQEHVDLARAKGLARMGLRANATWALGPRRFMIVLSRYKFVAKMLSGKDRVLEVGCGDAFGTRIVQQEDKSICAIDFDPVFVAEVNVRMDYRWKFLCIVQVMLFGLDRKWLVLR